VINKVKPPRHSPKAVTKRREDVKRLTYKGLLQEELKFLRSHTKKCDKNSMPAGRWVKPNDVRLWDPFITVDDVEALWEGLPELNKAMEEEVTECDLRRAGPHNPNFGAIIEEIDFEILWRSTCHPRINLVNEIFRKYRPGATSTSEDHYIKMGGGSSAKWISPNADPAATDAKRGKKPDHSGFMFEGAESQYDANNPKTVYNRIPGDAKLFRKIRRSWLPPDGSTYLAGQKRREAEKVLSQIHGYMDMHEARYGYIVTDEELIFLRRREGKWGQLDISPAIRHDVRPDRESGVLNSLYVMFYFHWKVANDDGPDGWRLESYGKT